MNITHSEPFDKFLPRYGSRRNYIKPMLDAFGPEALRTWLQNLGIETFTGSSGRVFPADMKAAPLLRAWLHRLRQRRQFSYAASWTGWTGDKTGARLDAGGEKEIRADAIVLAMGGGWARLGSTGLGLGCWFRKVFWLAAAAFKLRL
jgi:predicted flavoprotein YhiN